jgi:hypothetical protein
MEKLGKDVLKTIVSFLDYRDVCRVSQVSKLFAAVAKDDTIWQTLFETHYVALPTLTVKEMQFKDLFKLRFGLISFV